MRYILLVMFTLFIFIGCGEPKPFINTTTTSSTTKTGTVYASSKNYYKSLCDNGNGKGCRNLASLYELGAGVPRSLYRALKLNKKSCSLGYGAGCSRAGNYYEDGRSGVKDIQKAALYYRQGCDLNYATACNNIGNSYIDGDGVAKNLSLAEMYLKRAINLGNKSMAYSNLGFVYELRGDVRKAKKYYKIACDRNNRLGCSNLAVTLKGEKNYKLAYSYYLKACNLSKSSACNSISMMIHKKQIRIKNPNETMFQIDSKSCTLKNKIGCANLAYDYKKGIGARVNIYLAKKYYQKACDLGNKSSCFQAR